MNLADLNFWAHPLSSKSCKARPYPSGLSSHHRTAQPDRANGGHGHLHTFVLTHRAAIDPADVAN